ncbi:ATP-dependent helicase [Thermodesulfovibrio sp. Kuro-1]|uniref:ATP-dependent helicase n=1 Tax=Thermodesulfovibrio sp. Kuro-1 TaxID=2580394 RepID=UPI0011444243|nr:ATP-dependent helicase [Thermodesulfovibrio sp. Kuro-1]
MNLNKNQKIAVETSDRYLCILAGPGTGKTLTITAKIIHLLNSGINPEEIAALTFTQKAAIEMRERVLNNLHKKEDLPFIGTFHLLCIKLLREFLPEKEKYFKICTRTMQKEIISVLSNKNPDKIIEKITKFKNTGLNLDEKTTEFYEKYEQKKIELNLLDFDDLLIKTLHLLNKKIIPPLFSHIIIDEFQDINKIQYEIIKKLLKKEGSLSVFGDPDQAIYSFRGSEIDLFLNLPKDFKNLTLINLSLNYRSQANIIYASNKFITANIKRFSKKIEPLRQKGSKLTLIEVEDEYDEGKTIVKEIKSRLGASDFTETYGNREETQCTFSNFAVLARTNRQLKIIKDFLAKAGIPVKTIRRDTETWIASIVKKLTELISGGYTSKKILKDIRLSEFLESSGILEGLNDLEVSMLKNISKSYDTGKLLEQIHAFIDELSGLTSFDLFPENLNAVSLLTFHASKGLEFPVVFITGFEEGLVPYTLSSDYDLEEERRLFYVGMTRAMNDLIIIHAKNRLINGKKLSLPISSFIKEIPSECIAIKEVRIKKDVPKQNGLF